MTKELFRIHPEQIRFNACIVAKERTSCGWKVALDQTCFYPGGGGQPADKGRLNGEPVVRLEKEGSRIYHYLKKDITGPEVSGRVDWDHRLDYMEQHTGQHIISAVMWREAGIKTVSVHMGEAYTTIETDRPALSAQELGDIEHTTNDVITRNLPLTLHQADANTLDAFPLRKPSPVGGRVQVVQMGDYDAVVCCGVHLPETGRVGLVKSIGTEKIRGHARVKWKIGGRAYKDYAEKTRIINRLQADLSVDQDGIAGRVKQMLQDVAALKKQNNILQGMVAVQAAQELYEKRESVGPFQLVLKHWTNENPDMVNRVTKALMDRPGIVLCVANQTQDSFQWLIACSRDVDFDFNSIRSELLAPYAAKGGGRFPRWQGMGKGRSQAADFVQAIKRLLAHRA